MSGGAGSTVDEPVSPIDDERARKAGAQITAEPHDTDYGSRHCAAQDPEGNHWSFGTYRGEPARDNRRAWRAAHPRGSRPARAPARRADSAAALITDDGASPAARIREPPLGVLAWRRCCRTDLRRDRSGVLGGVRRTAREPRPRPAGAESCAIRRMLLRRLRPAGDQAGDRLAPLARDDTLYVLAPLRENLAGQLAIADLAAGRGWSGRT